MSDLLLPENPTLRFALRPNALSRWAKDGSGLWYPLPDVASALLKEGIAKGYYQPPEAVIE